MKCDSVVSTTVSSRHASKVGRTQLHSLPEDPANGLATYLEYIVTIFATELFNSYLEMIRFTKKIFGIIHKRLLVKRLSV